MVYSTTKYRKKARGLRSRSRFLSTKFFPGKLISRSSSIREYTLPGPVSVPPIRTGQFLSRLSPKNETEIPEFEISGKIPEIRYWTGNFLLGTEICYIMPKMFYETR